MLSGVRQSSIRAWRWLAGLVFEPGDRDTPVRVRFGVHLAGMLALAVLVAAVAGAVVWSALGRPRLAPQAPGPLAPSDLYDGIKIALAVVAGIGGVVALVVAYRRQRFAEREHHRAEAAVVREDTKLFTERFGKASEQLGSDKAAVRLAGVYALASLADDWPAGRQMCIDVLCAYLRMPYPPPVEQGAERVDAAQRDGEVAGVAAAVEVDEVEQRARLQERQVRHTIIRVITAHLRESAPVSWQGCDFDFSGAVFDGGDFSGAMFSGGRVDFSGAVFSGGRVNFYLAVFSGSQVDFVRAVFSGGQVHFGYAVFSDGQVDFSGAEFSGGQVDLSDARFSGGRVTFYHSVFSGGQVPFVRARFSGGQVDFSGTRFSGGQVDFSGAEFSGGQVNFYLAVFSGSQVNFVRARFSGGQVDFSDAGFSGGQVDFSDAVFSGGQVDLADAVFSGGQVDLSRSGITRTQPVFDYWTDRPPDGLLLPTADAADDDIGSARDAVPN